MVDSKEFLIPKLIKALDQEILSTKNNNNKIVIQLSEGLFICKDSKVNIYKFTLDSSIHPVDSIPIEIIVDDTRFNGHVIQSQDQEITIGIHDDIGKKVSNAKIIIKLASILELLKAKLKESYNSKQYLDFHLANHFFENPNDESIPALIPGLENLLKEYNQDNESDNINLRSPNAAYPEKIRMLAHIVGSFIKTDMKILMVSNNNNFIDEATLCLADNLRSNDNYKQGKLIHLGAQENNDLFNEYEFIIPDKIIQMHNGIINKEKDALNQRIGIIDKTLMKLTQGLEMIQRRDVYFDKIQKLSENLNLHNHKMLNINKIITQQEKRLVLLSNKLKKEGSSDFINTILIHLGFNTVKKSISATEKELAQRRQELAKVNDSYKIIKEQRNQLGDKLQTTHNHIFAFLGDLNLSENKLKDKYKELSSERDNAKSRISEIDAELKLIRSYVLSNAKMIGTNLNTTFLSNDFTDLNFDILVVDEASIPSEPQLYWALCKCKLAAIIVGDCLKFVVPSNSL